MVEDERDPRNTTSISGKEMAAAADQLDSFLRAYGVVPKPTSWPALAMAAARQADAWARDHECLKTGGPCPHLHESLARAQFIADLLVMVELVEAVLRGKAELRITERLRMLAAGDHSSTSSALQSNERDRVFELMCAGWMSGIATDVDLVDPPDVVCTYRGVSWGVACKSVRGTARRAFGAIKTGIDQLESSTCAQGAVLVRMTDVFPHEELVPGRAPGMKTVPSFLSAEDAFEVAMGLARPFVASVVREASGGSAFFQRSKKLEAVVFVAHSLANMHTPRGAVSMTVPIPHFLTRRGSDCPFIDDFIRAFSPEQGSR